MNRLKVAATCLIASVTLALSWHFLQTSQLVATRIQRMDSEPSTSAVRQISTDEYIDAFDPAAFEIAGTDFFNERYSPKRLNKPLELIDVVFDFDFAYLNEVSERLATVDRRRTLKAIFEKLTVGTRNDTERHLAVLAFLQKAAFHSAWMQPMYEDKQAVLDPLVLLDVGAMRCSAVARVGADLFDAAGYKARLVQAVAHTTAEIFYENDWHLFEADLTGGGQAPMLDGKILSVRELSENHAVIDRLPTRFEAEVAFPPEKRKDTPYPSYFFFSRQGYGSLKPSWYYKTALPEQARVSQFYGWNYYETVVDTTRTLSNRPVKYEPMRPRLQSVDIKGDSARITWEGARDKDGDLLGYRVYISEKSRGWNYQFISGGESVKRYWNGGWKPEMYDALFQEPPSEVALVTTRETSIEIDLPPGEQRYVTVMPYDKYGESIGRRLYNMSAELTLAH